MSKLLCNVLKFSGEANAPNAHPWLLQPSRGFLVKWFYERASWDILDTWPKRRNCVLSISGSGSTFRIIRALQISQLQTLSRSVTWWILHQTASLPFAH